MSKKCDRKCDNCDSGKCSTANGFRTTACGDFSSTQGFKTRANGIAASAQGNHSLAEGNSSNAQGCHTKAIGNCSHAEGSNTIAKGCASHAEGECTEAIGTASHAEGVSTKAKCDGAHAEGYAKDGNINSSGHGSHAEGSSKCGTISASREGSHAEGNAVKGIIQASNHGSHAEGFSSGCLIIERNDFHINNPLFTGNAGGGVSIFPELTPWEIIGNQTALLGGTTIGSAGMSGMVTGPQMASTMMHNTPMNVTSGGLVNGQMVFNNGIAQNNNNNQCITHTNAQITASGRGAHAEGFANKGHIFATGQGAHAEGLAELGTTIAGGNGSHAEGINTLALGIASRAGGIQSMAPQRAQISHSSGAFANVGDNQSSTYHLKIQNPSTTIRPIYTFTLDGSGIISPLTVPIVPDNTSWTVHALIIGRDNGTHVHSEIKNACVSRANGNSTLMVVDDVPNIIQIFGNPASFTQLNVDTANGAIVLQATPGLVTGTYPAMRWHCVMTVSSVTWPTAPGMPEAVTIPTIPGVVDNNGQIISVQGNCPTVICPCPANN